MSEVYIMQIVETTKIFQCICGKTFTNAQSFNGHKSHCRSHQLAKGGAQCLEASIERQRKASEAAQAAIRAINLNKQESANQIWLMEKHTCEKCGQLMLEKFGTGRFCSRACANSRVHSDETKQKIKASLDNTLALQAKPASHNKKVCNICGIVIKSTNKTGVCRHCLDTTSEGLLIKQELGRKGYRTKQSRGTHKGWQSRNITSYAEQFWMQVLDNNGIKYQREVPIKHNTSNYFLDFVLERNGMLVDLEIDGKQHTYSDRIKSDVIRDLFLTKQGYLVYRIAWNEVSSELGKEQMSQKINDFLKFYRAL